MPAELIFGVNENGFVVLGKNNYNYSNNDNVIRLLKEYKKVLFEDNFNSNIDWLPEGITDIYIGMAFNKPLQNLPSTTKNIKIMNSRVGYVYFNQPLEYLPDGLEELTILFGTKFNQPLDYLPSNLKYLHIYSLEFMQAINNLPDTLETLRLRSFDYANTHKLPSNLKTIHLSEHKDNVDNLNKLEYKDLRKLQNNYPNIEFMYNI